LGCSLLWAEKIPIEPDPGNAGVGKWIKVYNKATPLNIKSSDMKKVALLLSSILLPFISFCQFYIKGQILNAENKQTITGASVIIENTFIGSVTNSSGNFSLGPLKSGKYTIIVKIIGFNDFTDTIYLKKDISVVYNLIPKAIMQDEVIINATRASENIPSTYQIIDKIEIEKNNFGQDLPYLLEQSPSIVTTSDAGAGIGYTSLRLRGSDLYRINVTLNGIPVNDAESQGVFWVDLPDLASSVDDIQIQRGVGTSTNGGATFGGSINIKTHSLKEKPYAVYNGSFGSFNTIKNSFSIGTGLIDQHFSFDFKLSKLNSDGFIDRAFTDMSSFDICAAYYKKNSIIKFIALHGKEKTYQAWNGVPSYIIDTNRTFNGFTYENQTDNYTQSNFQLHYSNILKNKLKLNFSTHYTRGDGYYEEFQDVNNPWGATSFSSYGLPNFVLGNDTITNSDLIRQKWLSNDFFGVVSSFIYSIKKFDFIIGSGWNKYIGEHFGEIIWAKYYPAPAPNFQWYKNTGNKSDFNAYMKVNLKQSEKILFFSDLQFRRVMFGMTGTEDGFGDISSIQKPFNFINPKIGFVIKPKEGQQGYFSFAISHREPNRNNYVDATNNPVKPDREILYDFETGISIKTSKFYINPNIFLMLYKDQLVFTGELNDVGYPIMSNVNKSFREGIEISYGMYILSNLKWDINFAYSLNKIVDFIEYVSNYDSNWNWLGYKTIERGSCNISFSPAIVSSSQICWNITERFEFYLTAKYIGKQYIDNTGLDDHILVPYLINNINLNWNLLSKKSYEIDLNLLINNLFNIKYESNAWISSYLFNNQYISEISYYPQAGRNFLVNIRISFSE